MPRFIPAVTLRVGFIYFVLAVLAIKVARFDGGVAVLWFATAYLVAELTIVRRREWLAKFAAAGAGSMLATGLFGLGWAAALPMAAANMLESFVIALLLRRQLRQTPFESYKWLGHFVFAAVVAPLVSAPIAALVTSFLGNDYWVSFGHWVAGHALCNLTFAPLLILLAQGEQRNCWRQLRGRRRESFALIGLSLATTSAVFAQSQALLLFLPVLPIILATFRLGRVPSALMIIALALIGGLATLTGHGPIESLSQEPEHRAQFFQFYLAMTVVTVWPAVAELRNRARLHDALRTSEEHYRLIADHSSDILLKLDCEGRIRYVSPSIRKLCAFEPSWLIGRDGIELIPEQDRERVRLLYRKALGETERAHCFEYEALTADASRRWFETHTRAVINSDGTAIGTMSIIRDITERKATERSLSEAAHTDVLTGLPNRRALRDAVDARVAAGMADRDCIALLDIDHFKRINDLHGHPVGDIVLRNFAAAATQAVRENDIVVRFGGEEFVVLFLDTPLERALQICERLRTRVGSAVTMADGAAVRITVSGGVAPIGPSGLAEALKVADAALYRAKSGGRDQLAIAA